MKKQYRTGKFKQRPNYFRQKFSIAFVFQLDRSSRLGSLLKVSFLNLGRIFPLLNHFCILQLVISILYTTSCLDVQCKYIRKRISRKSRLISLLSVFFSYNAKVNKLYIKVRDMYSRILSLLLKSDCKLLTISSK